MLTNRSALALLAAWALSALASPIEPLVVQDSNHHLATNNICLDTKSDPPLELITPEVYLDDGIVVGFQKGATDNFLGIPFAEPPTGQRRLRRPEPFPPYEGIYYAQKFGKSCPQQQLTLPNGLNSQLIHDIGNVVGKLYDGITPDDEDCLTINVVRPAGTRPGTKLPVVVWIFGGGFEIGGAATYNGGVIVSRSIELGEPFIFVSMNHRLSAFGFLPGKEVKEAKVGNLGLQDQRLALKWVQTYISEFGGDPSKVTIWGESSGAISVALHMLANKGNQEGLFRGAIMQSGGPIPVGDIENGQRYYDFMVERTGCRGSNNTLECLRRIPYNTFKHAMDESPNFFAYQGLVLAWVPRVDGVFLTEPPQHAVLRGHVSNVPLITGNCDDEGSLFSISTMNVSTTADLKDYLKLYMMPTAKDEEIDLLLKYYPDDQRAGCPFDTGLKNALSAQYKRTAALQGDFVFHGPRRFFLKHRADKQNSWAFIWKRAKSTPVLGTTHATDLINSILTPGELMDYVIHFTSNLNPNSKKGLGIPWPQWNRRDPKAIVLQDSTLFPVVIGNDNYRTDPLDYVANMSLIYPI
ncbi:Alpha/Beta hydrolase protein [Multifurca ochricompacta]|uniref:Carboxylic ester hydrolase n=1 Tax=Multifurca ochricompacta TaxID=376703 RepID=A0AAD4MBN7_9AGAM|nr:Alpha/Beta hydrolase protein [Multifurca ochricompacta]